MAVVQISKIQVRRGQKNSGIGVPQLSSAEFAWAVDSQELFIGNGSVAEGAPAVGNTKILTEHDNILGLAASYRFAADDNSITLSIPRGLQSKLDEIQVSVVDFGAIPDGSTDSTLAFTTAIDELFKNSNDKFKKILAVPNGVYLFLDDLIIPSNVLIKGENSQETVLEIGDNNIIFQDISGRPQGIVIENLTINHNDGQTVITGSQECKFKGVKWRSGYVLGDVVFVSENASCVYSIPTVSGAGGQIQVSGGGVSLTIDTFFTTTFANTLGIAVGTLNSDPTFSANFEATLVGGSIKIGSKSDTTLAATVQSNFTVRSKPDSSVPLTTVTPTLAEFTDGSANVNASVFWENTLFGTRVTKLVFEDCKWYSTPLAVECQQTVAFDSVVDFEHCEFFVCDTGIYIGGVGGQGNLWHIDDCHFEEVANQAFISTQGRGTQFQRSRFVNCGNNTNSASAPYTSIVSFGESFGNTLINCSSNRHQESGIVSVATADTRVEFENASLASLVDRNYSELYLSDAPRPLAVFSAYNNYIYIDYTLRLSQHVRTGQIVIVINTLNTDIEISDTYTYSGGGIVMTGFEFFAELKNNSNYDDSTGPNNDTLLLKYQNPLISGATGSIEYSITYGV
jgi:hypothetical protein